MSPHVSAADTCVDLRRRGGRVAVNDEVAQHWTGHAMTLSPSVGGIRALYPPPPSPADMKLL